MTATVRPEDAARLLDMIEAAVNASEVAEDSRATAIRTEDPADLFDAEEDLKDRERLISEACSGWEALGRPTEMEAAVRALPGSDRWIADAGVDPATVEAFDSITDVHEPTSWAPVDLSAALAGIDIEPPVAWERSDGHCFLYAGRTHWFQGESESCKSMAAQAIAVDQLVAGGRVLYLDFEDDDRGVVARLLAMGAKPDDITAGLVYVRPDEGMLDRRHHKVTGAQVDLGRILDSGPFALAVIDGVTEAMTLEGLELNDNSDVAAWIRALPKRISATGPPVVVIDHVVKSGDAQGRYAIGGQHKLAGVTGAAYRFTTTAPLARPQGAEPVEAAIAITVMKDRPGHVRGHAVDGKVGTVEITAWPDGRLDVRLAAPNETTRLDMVMAQRILDYLADYDMASTRSVRESVEGKSDAIQGTLRALVTRGWVSVEHKGQSHLHSLTEAGRRVAAGGEP